MELGGVESYIGEIQIFFFIAYVCCLPQSLESMGNSQAIATEKGLGSTGKNIFCKERGQFKKKMRESTHKSNGPFMLLDAMA